MLTIADKDGMEVSEVQFRLYRREGLVKARLTMHGFNLGNICKTVEAGMAIANETRHTGEAALREKDRRRLGLAVSVFLILLAVTAIWLLIRRIEGRGEGAGRMPA